MRGMMRLALLGVPGAQGAGSVTFTPIFQDLFTTDDAAPVTSPRTAEPGPGTATINDAAAVIGGGKLQFATFNKLYLTTTTFARQTGRAFFMVDAPLHNDNSLGAYLSAANQSLAAQEGLGAKSDLAVGRDSTVWQGSAGIKVAGVDLSLMDVPPINGYGIYKYLLVCRSAGGFAIVGGEAFDNHWYLVHVRNDLNAANLRLGACAYNHSDTVGKLLVGDLSGVWQDDYGIATHRTETPVGTVTATSEADAEIEVTWTPQADETLELSFRRTDDNNRLIVRCIQADGTINLIKCEAGSESSLSGGAVAQTWTVGTPYRIVARYQGGRTDIVVNSTRHASATETFHQTATGIQVSGGETLSNFVAWPVDVTQHIPVSAFSHTQHNVLPFGDSKTSNFYAPRNSYPMELMRFLNTGDNAWWQEFPLRLAAGGATARYFAINIDAMIALHPGRADYILINLGVNDVNGDTQDVLRDGTGDAWKADMDYVLDALHAAYPDALIYMMRVWKRGDATVQSKLDFIDDVMLPAFVAARPYCHLGPDERVFLEGGDDGVTYTTDGIHPNEAGYTLTAQQWAAVLLA